MSIPTFFTKSFPIKFVVQNITDKQIKIFACKIPPGQSKDLFALPYISEDDIRHSLLKGELKIKFNVGDISLVETNINLLQFENSYQDYLESIGAITGVRGEPGPIGPVGPPPTPKKSEEVDISVSNYTFTNIINRLYVGVGGDVYAKFTDDPGPRLWKNVGNGMYLDGNFETIFKTNTTAQNLIGIVDTSGV